jgi:integrase
MGSSSPMIYNSDSDLWIDTNKRTYIKNEFDHLNPCFIEVSGDIWVAVWKGRRYELNWNLIKLPKDILDPIKLVASVKLKSSEVAATYIGTLYYLVAKLSQYWPMECHSFDQFGISQFLLVWGELTASTKSMFREIFRNIVATGAYGADGNLATRMQRWKARSNLKTLNGVVSWDPLTGALTSAELALLRERVTQRPEVESDKSCAMRLLCWILIETIKRTEQILSLKADALKLVVNQGVIEYFLDIPKAKVQSGEASVLWGISSTLGKELIDYSGRAEIQTLQLANNRLMVWNTLSLRLYGQAASQDGKAAIMNYVQQLDITSPRTLETLYVTPYRLRHSGATSMAAQGVSREVIMHILEHDDITSAQAYIDAIGSDLVPAIERADRKLGDLFKGLNDIFFKGKIVHDLGKVKLFIPIFNANPMHIGSCGKDTIKQGACKKQPFVACYNGCPDFLAWAEADHIKALTYVENEFERWSQVEGHNGRSKAIKDFEQLHHAINEVIHQIEGVD